MNKVEIVYDDGSTASLSVPNQKEIDELQAFHEEMMNRFFPDGIPVFDETP